MNLEEVIIYPMDSDEDYVVDASKSDEDGKSQHVASVLKSLIRGGEVTDVSEVDPKLLQASLLHYTPAFPKKEAHLPQ